LIASRSEITVGLKRAAVGWLVKRGYSVNLELGLLVRGKLKADLVGLRLDGTLVIVEIKSGPADLSSDKKWRGYQAYCNFLYLGITEEHWKTIDKTLPAGIMVLDTKTGHMWVRKRAKRHAMEGKLKKQMVIRMAYRGAKHTKRNTRRTRIFLK
jgi:hypothetical protein